MPSQSKSKLLLKSNDTLPMFAASSSCAPAVHQGGSLDRNTCTVCRFCCRLTLKLFQVHPKSFCRGLCITQPLVQSLQTSLLTALNQPPQSPSDPGWVVFPAREPGGGQPKQPTCKDGSPPTALLLAVIESVVLTCSTGSFMM